ncbi:hypothetical protein [Flavobacterium suzhouense]|uniref:Uncharacterized protein n=1 Tax=Flavobacterium suzhouense TaxID=1529638 RepID=A0ABW5NRK0_9FLAO
MKTIHNINTGAVFCNVFLFMVPPVGMLLMMLLGTIQIVLALTLTFYWATLNKKEKQLLNRYWLFVGIDFIFIALTRCLEYDLFDLPGILFYFLFPGFIAFYFLYLTNYIYKNSRK